MNSLAPSVGYFFTLIFSVEVLGIIRNKLGHFLDQLFDQVLCCSNSGEWGLLPQVGGENLWIILDVSGWPSGQILPFC